MADFVSSSIAPVPVNNGVYSAKYSADQQKNKSQDNSSVYTTEYRADQQKKSQELVAHRAQRQESPAWNTLKEVVWAPLMSFFQLGQAVGSFAGHLVVALPAAIVGGVFGTCIYAPFMKAVDLIGRRENTKSFFEYAIKPAQLLSNLAYNRVTDFLSRYVLGPALLITVVEPLLYLAVAAGVAVALSPLIYRDFAHNNSQNVEYFIDNPLSASVKWGSYHHIWQRLDSAAAGKKIHGRAALPMGADSVPAWVGKPDTPAALRSPGG
ncbi:hypothetical protein [Endozoicomonas sp.]|uniref:hypothetical protein n=1 Tax=Endozoicomonas sp. TaxID=1892382 RepID=UPI00288448D3|nr:hypothetical protein [Endozoicomonas sp.]